MACRMASDGAPTLPPTPQPHLLPPTPHRLPPTPHRLPSPSPPASPPPEAAVSPPPPPAPPPPTMPPQTAPLPEAAAAATRSALAPPPPSPRTAQSGSLTHTRAAAGLSPALDDGAAGRCQHTYVHAASDGVGRMCPDAAAGEGERIKNQMNGPPFGATRERAMAMPPSLGIKGRDDATSPFARDQCTGRALYMADWAQCTWRVLSNAHSPCARSAQPRPQ